MGRVPLVMRLLKGGPSSVGFLIVGVLFLVSVFPGLLADQDPYAIDTDTRMRAPSRAHLFGTDELGRDLYSRVVHGTGISLGSALLVVGVSGLFGAALGVIAGYAGGWLNDLLMRLSDVFIAFPGLIMAMALVSFLGPSLTNAMLALIVIWWPQYARLARSQVVVEKGKPYVEAGRAVGMSDAGLVLRYILPNAWVPLLVKATLDIGLAILLTSSLSFLGLGAKPPSPELGSLVTQGKEHLLTAWWYSTFPGMVMFLAVLAFNLMGDSLRDALDPTLSDQ